MLGATSANGCVDYVLLFMNINDPACPEITFPSFLGFSGVVGTSYSYTFTASGGTGPYVYTIGSGSLPPGLSFATNGNLTGTPSAAGTFGFTTRATDSNGCAGERSQQLVISNAGCPVITVNPSSATLPPGATGTSYNQTFSATGGAADYSFSISLGLLPPGLSLAANGNLTGSPTTAGNYSFTVRTTDANGCAGLRTYTLAISTQVCPAITINPSTLPAGTSGSAYSQMFTATGGAAAYAFAISSGTLPNGLSLSPNGNLSGTPAATGNFTFTVRATDANGCTGERAYTLAINNPACPTITVNPSSLPAGTSGSAYSQTFTATGGTAAYAFSISSGTLPNGLSLSSNGNLSGTPAATGSFTFTVRATDANGCTGERGYTLVINNPGCPTITINPATLPAGRTGAVYNQTLTATGGTASYAYSISTGTLPAGLSLSSNGTLSGTPTTPGSSNFSVRATDANGCAGVRSYTLTVAPGIVTSVSAASYAPTGPLAPESIVAAFGANMATSTDAATIVPLPTELAGVSLVVRDSAGAERLAPLYYVSSSQINYQIPPGTSLGTASVSLLNEGQLTNTAVVMATGVIEVVAVSPGLFSADSTGRGLASALAQRVRSDGTSSYEPVARFDTAQNRFVAEPIRFRSGHGSGLSGSVRNRTQVSHCAFIGELCDRGSGRRGSLRRRGARICGSRPDQRAFVTFTCRARRSRCRDHSRWKDGKCAARRDSLTPFPPGSATFGVRRLGAALVSRSDHSAGD